MVIPVENEDYRALEKISAWLQQRTGIFCPPAKMVTLQHKLFKVCLQHRTTLPQIASCLINGTDRALCLQVIAAASTNHTAFFREEIWDYFKDHILRELLATQKQLRIWSAAASSGEEAYTIAMCAAELVGLATLKQKIAILGTDINFKVLKRAEEGIYTSEQLDGLEKDILQKYFTFVSSNFEKKGYIILDKLREVCLFRRLNLKKRPWPFKKRFHVIFCRNVLYYFDKKEREEIINALWDQTEPGGYLVVSVTESLAQIKCNWQKTPQIGVYRKG